MINETNDASAAPRIVGFESKMKPESGTDLNSVFTIVVALLVGVAVFFWLTGSGLKQKKDAAETPGAAETAAVETLNPSAGE